MVPIVILKTKDMRNSTNIFLINLSVADLLVLLVCTPTVLVEMNTRPETWVLGESMCKLVPFIELMVAHASILTILAISFERYYAICEPLKAGYVCTKTRAIFICVACWIIAGIFTSPIFEIATYRFEEYFDKSIVPICVTNVETTWSSIFFIFSISVFFVLPLLILIVIYTVIAKHLMINPSLISTTPGNRSNFFKYRKQVIFMLIAVVLSFFICLLPFRALTLWIIWVPADVLDNLLQSEKGIEYYYMTIYLCRGMWYLNSAINPILYNLMSSKFREGFLKLLGCRPLMRTTSWSEGTRKGTFHTASTNLSSSHHGNNVNSTSENNHRLLRSANNNDLNNVKSVERAPLNVIKYVKIVVDEKLADSLDINNEENSSDGELDVENLKKRKEKIRRQNDKDEETFNNDENNITTKTTNRLLIKSNIKKNNYISNENVKNPINSCSIDKCSPDDKKLLRVTNIDSTQKNDTTNHDKDFCINIYNLISAKESLV